MKEHEFLEGMEELAKHDDAVFLNADTWPANKAIPCGAAQQNMMGIAAGLAQEGKTVIIATPARLALSTCWQQAKYACSRKANIKIIGLGESAEDLALAKALPNITILAPADSNEAKKAVIAAGTIKGPVYIKISKEKQSTTEKTPFTLGRAEIMRAGKDCTIIAHGHMVAESLQAAKKLSGQEIECTVLNCHTIQPIDKHAILSSAKLTGCITIAEEQAGLGAETAKILAEHSPVPMRTAESCQQIIKAVKEAVLQKCEAVCPEMPEEHGRKLWEASQELQFRMHNGGVIKSIPGLHKALLAIDTQTFTHHCNESKNDFSTWVKDVFKDTVLASQLEKAKTRIGMINTLARNLR